MLYIIPNLLISSYFRLILVYKPMERPVVVDVSFLMLSLLHFQLFLSLSDQMVRPRREWIVFKFDIFDNYF